MMKHKIFSIIIIASILAMIALWVFAIIEDKEYSRRKVQLIEERGW